jgi:hypothetical protein
MGEYIVGKSSERSAESYANEAIYSNLIFSPYWHKLITCWRGFHIFLGIVQDRQVEQLGEVARFYSFKKLFLSSN